MRLALKSTLAFAAIYLVVVGGVAWWMAAQLRSLAANMAQTTAELVGGEVARSVADTALDQLQRADDLTLLRLHQLVDDVTQHSSILTSLAVVDRSGTVIAGDHVELGRQLALPNVIFGEHHNARLLDEPSGGGSFYMLVPLRSGNDLAGYLRLEMHSQRIAHLYSRAASHLVLITLVGLLAVGGVGLLLHTQLSQRSTMLTRAIESAVRGDPTLHSPAPDEFADALAAARQVGRELSEARGERVQAEQRMGALMKALDVGVLMVDPDLEAGFANQRAVELLASASAPEAMERWNRDIRPLIGDRPHHSNGNGAGSGFFTIELPASDAGPGLLLEMYEVGDNRREGYLVVVKGAEFIAALQSELGLAIQMRGITRFYAAFAHDLKAPLNAMVMTLELLKLSLQSGAGDAAAQDKQAKYLGVLNDEIRRLDRQVRTLLSHTAPPSDARTDMDLRALLQDLEALLAPQARRQRVTLITTLPDEPVPLVGQADRLKQAMLNILINALEAMPEGGALTITLDSDKHSARITVQDDGPGIPPDLLNAIYDMHFTTKTGGTGVGLYVARSVVHSHGGMIHVESEPGAGTTFTVSLPRTGSGPETASAGTM